MNDDIDFLVGKSVFIFGAGLSGASAYKKLKDRTDVKGFLDNNSKLANASLHGLKIQNPQHWRDSGVTWDYVLIASEHFESISGQLQNQFYIPEDKIRILPARITKPVNLGQSSDLKENAYKILFLLSKVFETSKINYYVDAGTLLGIHRDGKLIPWDDDIDIAVNASELGKIQVVLQQVVEELSGLFGVDWTFDIHYSPREFGAVPKGAVRGIKVRAQEYSEKLPMIDLFVKYVHGDDMDYTLSSRGIRMPSQHLLKTDIVSYQQQLLRFPYDVDGYLTAHYGDWRTPVKDWNLSMLKNSQVYE